MLQGIEQAKGRALIENQDLQIMIIKLPSLRIHSSNLNVELLSPHLQSLPVKLPESIWTFRKFFHKSLALLLFFFCYSKVQIYYYSDYFRSTKFSVDIESYRFSLLYTATAGTKELHKESYVKCHSSCHH